MLLDQVDACLSGFTPAAARHLFARDVEMLTTRLNNLLGIDPGPQGLTTGDLRRLNPLKFQSFQCFFDELPAAEYYPAIDLLQLSK